MSNSPLSSPRFFPEETHVTSGSSVQSFMLSG